MQGRLKKLQRDTYKIIREDDDNDLAADIFDGIIITLIVLNVVFIILDTFTMPDWFVTLSKWFERISVGLFTLEYLARLWTAPLRYPKLHPVAARLRFAVQFLALIDLISILPFYFPLFFSTNLRVLRLLRVVRLFRVFKVSRYTHALEVIKRVFQKKANQLVSSLFTIFLLIVIASVLMYSTEHTAQPSVFKNALDGLWWALATVTQADYGDIYPVTTLGRVLSAVIALLGIGLIAVPTGIISAGFVEEMPADGAPRPAPPSDTGTFSPGAARELLLYKRLLDNGGITPQEYEVKKQELLKP